MEKPLMRSLKDSRSGILQTTVSLQWHLFEGRGGEAHNEAQKVSSTRRVLEAKMQPVLNSQESPSR
jgi:hypothetical protein